MFGTVAVVSGCCGDPGLAAASSWSDTSVTWVGRPTAVGSTHWPCRRRRRPLRTDRRGWRRGSGAREAAAPVAPVLRRLNQRQHDHIVGDGSCLLELRGRMRGYGRAETTGTGTQAGGTGGAGWGAGGAGGNASDTQSAALGSGGGGGGGSAVCFDTASTTDCGAGGAGTSTLWPSRSRRGGGGAADGIVGGSGGTAVDRRLGREYGHSRNGEHRWS